MPQVSRPSDGTALAAHEADTYLHPRELGYAEGGPADFTTTSTSAVDVTGLTTTVTVGARPVKVDVCLPTVKSTDAGDAIVVQIVEDGTVVWAAVIDVAVAAESPNVQSFGRRRDVAAGSHTWKLQTYRLAGAGTITIGASSALGIIPWIHVYELAAT